MGPNAREAEGARTKLAPDLNVSSPPAKPPTAALLVSLTTHHFTLHGHKQDSAYTCFTSNTLVMKVSREREVVVMLASGGNRALLVVESGR